MSDTEVREKFHYDEHLKRPVIETYQNIQPILDINTRLRNATPETGGFRHRWRLSAAVPKVLWHMWQREAREKGINLWTDEGSKWIKKKLNDPDFRKIRTYHSKI